MFNRNEQLTPEAVVAAILRTRFIVYFIVCSIAVAVLASLSHTIGSKYIYIDLSIVGIFGKDSCQMTIAKAKAKPKYALHL